MKKLVLILLVVTLSSFTSISTDSNVTEINAEFVGKSNKALYFKKSDDQKMMEFNIVNMNVLSKYDLSNKSNIGKIFKLTYETQELETSVEDIKNKDAKVSKHVERYILMDIEIIE